MENDNHYRAQLKNQIKDACGKVIYTYTAHHKLADRLEKKIKYMCNAEIILTALFFVATLVSFLTGNPSWAWMGLISVTLCLFLLNLYFKEYKIRDEINQHRKAANTLWGIREEYVSLLVDFETLEDSEIQKKRDVLCNKVSEVNNHYPATDKKSYKAAQKALQKEEEQTFKENEVDSILPDGIDK